MFKALFIDLSGVLYEGRQLIPGAIEAIQCARDHQLVLRFVTNTSRRSRDHLLRDLLTMGFDIYSDEIYTAPVAAKQFLQQRGLQAYCLVHQDILEEFSSLEHSPAEISDEHINAVVVGDAAEGFSYDNLNRAFQLCQRGATLVGIGLNRYFKLDGKLLLDAGPFIKAIEYAADTRAVIMGKPSKDFFLQVLASTEIPAEQVLMIGDDIVGDVQGAVNAGLQGCLVRTGKYQQGDENKINQPHLCLASIVEVIELVTSGRLDSEAEYSAVPHPASFLPAYSQFDWLI